MHKKISPGISPCTKMICSSFISVKAKNRTKPWPYCQLINLPRFYPLRMYPTGSGFDLCHPYPFCTSVACGLLDRWENIKEEITVKISGFLYCFAVLVVVLTFSLSAPELGTFSAKAYAKQSHSESKIISDTLAVHKVTCLSRNGSIITVLLDGKWVDVRQVELVDHTLILRTDAGNLSLAAAINR